MTGNTSSSEKGGESHRVPHRVPNRPGPLASLPVFFAIAGKRAVVAGGSQAAAWKAELLAASGAHVDVYAAQFHERLHELQRETDHVRLTERNWASDDLRGAMMFIGDAMDEQAAEAMRAAAAAAGVPVNIIDKPAYSDFNFGSIVDRSPLVIAISTTGGAPVFGQAVRALIETILPTGLRQWASAAVAWRTPIAALNLPAQTRRDLWARFARIALARPGDVPDDNVRDMLIASAGPAAASADARDTGSVILAGSGPGDPELLTLKAVRALQAADVVLYDDLVAPAVLDLARREADKLSVGKRGFKPSCTQDDICRLLIELAQQGKRVVRLKGGDPMIFGRAGEEIAALQAAGVAVDVIPGVTAASAAAARLGVSLTERDLSRRVQFFTAHARNGSLPEDLNWPALADPHATSVAYMGVRTLSLLSKKLIAAGMPADTPAILAQHVSWDSEDYITATIETLPAIAVDRNAESPALIIIGKVAASYRPDTGT